MHSAWWNLEISIPKNNGHPTKFDPLNWIKSYSILKYQKNKKLVHMSYYVTYLSWKIPNLQYDVFWNVFTNNTSRYGLTWLFYLNSVLLWSKVVQKLSKFKFFSTSTETRSLCKIIALFELFFTLFDFFSNWIANWWRDIFTNALNFLTPRTYIAYRPTRIFLIFLSSRSYTCSSVLI
jgi:hypothetical protein